VAAVLAKAGDFANAQIRARRGGVEAWGEPLAVAQQLEKTPEFEVLHSLLPSDELSEGLERYGVYEGLLEGRRPPDTEECWEYLRRHLDQPHAFFSAIEAGGVDVNDGSTDPIDLSSNFVLRRFSEQEVVGWLPPKKYERRIVDPYITSQYWFVTREGRGLFNQRRRISSLAPPRYARDSIWDEWWLPFLCLSLFRDQFTTTGVRIEVVPGWSIRKVGEFEGQLVDDEEGRERWHRFDSGDFLLANEDRANLEEFARLVIPAAIQWAANQEEGPRFRAIGRSFLRAAWKLPPERAFERDLDRIEECLFGLVRSADGALHGKPHPNGLGLMKTFLRRFVACADLPDGDGAEGSPLYRAYEVRSGLAHAYDSPDVSAEDARRIWPLVRKCLLGYLGLFNSLGNRQTLIAHLNNGAPQTELSRKLWRLAKLA